MSKPIDWSEHHQREAWARIFELVANRIRSGSQAALDDIGAAAKETAEYCASIHGFRILLSHMGFGADRIGKETRRIDGLARGWLTRQTEVTWKGVTKEGHPLIQERRRKDDVRAELRAVKTASEPGDRIVKVTRTRIRRAK